MNIKNFFMSFLFLFLAAYVFAQNKTVVFFAESLDGVSAKVIQQIESSDKFCFAASFDEDKTIKKEIQNLIFSYKIEPVINITEPYFPLISSEINVSSSVVFNKADICKEILNNYKKNYRTIFERNKHGIYLKGSALTDDILNAFYKCNILWTIAKSDDDKQKGLFIKNEVALFLPYNNFTLSETKIKQWFNSVNNINVIPVILTKEHIKNEKFMLALIKFVDNDTTFDIELPINTAFYGYNSKTIKKDVSLKTVSKVPMENILKLYFADKEIADYGAKKENDEIYSILCDELSNMYSYEIINGIINNSKSSAKLFDISYANIFRMLNKKVPNINEFRNTISFKETLGTDNDICKFTETNNSMVINNSGQAFTSFSVSKDNNYVYFKTNADLTSLDSIDIYIDMNNMAYIGSQKMLKPLNAFFVPEHSWEFAVKITKTNIYVYKYLSDNAVLVENIPNETVSSDIKISSNILKGNPYNWSYQTVAVKNGEAVDFIENKDRKEILFNTLPLQVSMYKYNN